MNLLAAGTGHAIAPPEGRVLHPGVAMAEVDLPGELEAHHAASFDWAMCCCRFVRAEAEDVLQAAYMKVLEGRARFSGRATFRTWLFGVIRNTARERRRRELARRILSGRILVAAFGPAPDELVETARAQAQVRRALCALSPRQREVLELVLHQDLTLDEAAAVLRISAGTARKHYERGKAALRAMLAEMRPR